VTPLASKCIKSFTPAVLGPSGQVTTPASAECRTSELTLAEFKTLTGKMDAFNPAAQTPAQYFGGTPDFRTNVYAGPTSGHLLTFTESIALFKQLGVKMTPELKSPSVTMPFDGFSQEMYAQKLIDELKAAGDGDLYKVLDVLAKDVGILGVFSDWAAPVTFYANCMGLK